MYGFPAIISHHLKFYEKTVMGVAAETRHRYILDEVRIVGKIFVKDVSEKLKITEVTVRRDLAYLEKQGLLKKTYGGAVLTNPEMSVSVSYRGKKKLAAKKIVGRLAARLIKNGDIIYLEPGSTCNEIIPHLAGKKDVTVIVNSLFHMRRLHELTQHRVIIIGGMYRPERMDMVGPEAELAMGQLGGFKAFTGADDITIDAGISGADVVTVGFAKLVLRKASEVIFVGDHTKFDNPALYKIADIDKLNYIVTDQQPSKAWHDAAEAKNIKLIYPK